MLIGDVIFEYRKNNNLSLRDFAKKTGLSHTYISALEKKYDSRTGKPIAPTLESIKYISNALNISIDDLLKILDDNQEFKMSNSLLNEYKYHNKLIAVPVVGSISAGSPLLAEENVEGYLPIDPTIYNTTSEDKLFFLKVKGNSMNKLIKNGAYALMRRQTIAENGDVIAVIVNGDEEATLKKYKQLNDQFIILEPQSEDSSFETITIDLKKTTFRIIGKVIGDFKSWT